MPLVETCRPSATHPVCCCSD